MAMSLFPLLVFGQWPTDTTIALQGATISGFRQEQSLLQLPEVHQTHIVGGRKNEVIAVQGLPANLAEKTGRQIFAKIPGAFVYDMDGSGNQVNLATRGLDPHRSWEFNIRQNNVMINSDIYGYPASHYSPPMEAIKHVELVRGTASLQYGAGFGGMINYVVKTADTTKSISFESLNSVGSFGLVSSFNALGGKVGKFTYYGYYQKRISKGYRDNARSNAEAQFIGLKYDFSKGLSLRGELGRSTYLYQIPGPLTDSMFYANPRQSTRSRNYYKPDIYVPSLTLDWQINHRTTLNWVVSGVFGKRNSVEFEGFADKADLIDPITLQYKPRVVNIDQFNTKTTELRLLHHYQIDKFKNVVSVSLRYFNNDLHRQQQGKGTSGTDFDLATTGDWGRDLYYKSQSLAFSVENMVYLTPKFTVSPGFRYENGKTDMSGYIGYLNDEAVPNQIAHNIPTFGLNIQYKLDDFTRLYGGISQAYRPVLFKDIIPGSTLERANKNLKNAFGYNAELGISGRIKDKIKYEFTLFQIQYNNRLGNVVLVENGINYIYKTNIGNSQTNGMELYAEFFPLRSAKSLVSFFTATSLMKATYQNAKLAVGTENKDIDGNEVESVPRWISRNGMNLSYKTFTTTLQYSYVSKTFSDPTNLATPTQNGAKGLVPAYGIWDFNIVYKLKSRFIWRASVSNLTNAQYFTKRPLFYPGPGVWSSDGRSIVISLGVKI
jgi:Fe(3+) dicitrate transport protein